jgi:tetrahydromethanopterin S-methyltransferase subunit G
MRSDPEPGRVRYPPRMGSPANFEARLAAVEARLEEVAADATAARHLAAARDRDLAGITVKVDANRAAINGLGVQAAARFDQVDQRFDRLENKVDTGFAEMRAKFDQIDSKFDQVDAGFMEMRAKFDQTAAGMQQIVDLLTRREGP